MDFKWNVAKSEHCGSRSITSWSTQVDLSAHLCISSISTALRNYYNMVHRRAHTWVTWWKAYKCNGRPKWKDMHCWYGYFFLENYGTSSVTNMHIHWSTSQLNLKDKHFPLTCSGMSTLLQRRAHRQDMAEDLMAAAVRPAFQTQFGRIMLLTTHRP